MTKEEAAKELEEEFKIFLKGSGLDNEEHLEEKMKNNEDLRKVVEANRMAISTLSGDVRPNIHAHWKLVNPLQSDDGGAYCCSNCGSGIWGITPRYWKGCPWCLAIMDEKPFKNCNKTKCEACIYQGYCDREDVREPEGEESENV